MTNSHPKNPTNWLKRNLLDLVFILTILSVGMFIAYKNYIPGTWLLGWDNLVPEFNFKLNIARSLSAVWQEYQGVGLLGGMAHAADLPRQLILAGLSFLIPLSFIRYLWTFLMLVIGPVGLYFLIKTLLGPVSRHPNILISLASITSSIFYIFNLATVQTFFTPFETFLGFYGFLPWLLFSAIYFLRKGTNKSLFFYALISLFATGAFYVQTLFVVYVIFLSILALETTVRDRLKGFKKALKLALVTALVNTFWLLPILYFTVTSGQIPVNSHINSVATPETQYLNAARNKFSDLATLKGYWFDYYDWDQTGNDLTEDKFDYMYNNWIEYTNQKDIERISLMLFFISVFGIFTSLLTRKTLYGVSFCLLLGVCILMLKGSQISWIPLFSEMFRNSYTKWSTATSLVYAVGIGYFVYAVSLMLPKLKVILSILFGILIIAGSMFSVKPVLNGQLISENMRLELPSYYIDAFEYLNSVGNTERIATFPLTDYIGWKFHDWGYRGSGFIWYGIENPILDRAFDVWSPYNENFYNEVAPAVNADDTQNLEYVLAKYQVSYILFDDSVILPGNPNNQFILSKQKNFLENSRIISKDETFGKLTIYKVYLPQSKNHINTFDFDLSKNYFSFANKEDATVKETFPSIQGFPEARNCDLKEKGTVIRIRYDDGNFYGAYNGGIACDYFYYPTLDYSKAYSMRISGQNLSGRSLRFYLYNVRNKAVEMQELLPTGSFDKSYLIMPVTSSEEIGQGYTLTVETRSFGDVKSENKITSIEFSPVPYTKLSTPEEVSGNIKVLDVKKYGTWAYKTDVEGSGYIYLAQGYDEGWRAVNLPITNYKLTFLDQTKINSWSNGLFVPESSDSRVNSIFIFYWPQFLEWGGMFLGLITFTYLYFKRKH